MGSAYQSFFGYFNTDFKHACLFHVDTFLQMTILDNALHPDDDHNIQRMGRCQKQLKVFDWHLRVRFFPAHSSDTIHGLQKYDLVILDVKYGRWRTAREFSCWFYSSDVQDIVVALKRTTFAFVLMTIPT